MTAAEPRSDHPALRSACTELADRVPGIVAHAGGDGTARAPYASGTLSDPAGGPVELVRTVLWDGDGVVVRVAGGPYGAWAKPGVPDPDHQEGGLTFVPDHADVVPEGMLGERPAAQAALYELWQASTFSADDGSPHDGLVIMVRPDGVIAHLRGPMVDADALEVLVRYLPDVAFGAESHDPDWRETVHPRRDAILWPATVVLAGIIALVLVYLAYHAVR